MAAPTSSGFISLPLTVVTPALVGSLSSSRVSGSGGAGSSRAGGSGAGSSRADSSGPPPSTGPGGDVSMGALAALISRAVAEGMVAAAVSHAPVAPVVSATSPAPSLPTPGISAPSSSLLTAVAGAGAPVPPSSSRPPTSGEFRNVLGGHITTFLVS